ncbi:septum formation initiator family protein [Candidatus Saganbacteria bacterium]|nr:septum formation initiator family protein [Candidatus Saganbacteria bacterium]
MKFQFRRAVLIVLVFFILAGIHLFITTQNISLKYQVTDTKMKLNEIRAKNHELNGRVAAKENLALVEKQAREKLGMAYPEKIRYIIIKRQK